MLGKCGARFRVEGSMHWPSRIRICKERGGRGLSCDGGSEPWHVPWACCSRRLLRKRLFSASPSSMPVAIVRSCRSPSTPSCMPVACPPSSIAARRHARLQRPPMPVAMPVSIPSMSMPVAVRGIPSLSCFLFLFFPFFLS